MRWGQVKGAVGRREEEKEDDEGKSEDSLIVLRKSYMFAGHDPQGGERETQLCDI